MFTVALVLQFDVLLIRVLRAEVVDLNAVVDDEMGRDIRLDEAWIFALALNRRAECREVDDGGDTGKVLENDPRWRKRKFDIRHVRLPRSNVPNVLGSNGVAVDVPEDRLGGGHDNRKAIQFTQAGLFESDEFRYLIGTPSNSNSRIVSKGDCP